MAQSQIESTNFKKIAKSVVFHAISATVGFFLAIVIFILPTGGGGFTVKSPDGHKKILIMGFDIGLLSNRNVRIIKENEKTKQWETIFNYSHDADGLSLREQADKKINWSDDSAKVSITYRDKINSHDVVMAFEYDTKSGDWTLTNIPRK